MARPLQRFGDLLFQSEAERDAAFRDHIHLQARQGLRLVAGTIIVLPPVMTAALQLAAPDVLSPSVTLAVAFCMMAAGVGAWVSTKVRTTKDHPRTVAWLVGIVVATCLIWSSLLRAQAEPMFLTLINAQVALVLLIVLMSVPFRPAHVFLLGLGTVISYLVSCQLAVDLGIISGSQARALNMVFLVMVVLLSTAVSANLYHRIWETFLAHREQIRTMNEVRDSQCRMLLSDSAASMGRLAAALSHELNNPLAVLKSNLDTLRTLSSGNKSLPPTKQADRARLEADLYENATESINRLHATVQRMQRFTNLDRADVLPVDLNNLLRDVAELVADSVQQKASFEFNLQPLPHIEIRPQPMSAVFSAILQKALDASGEDAAVTIASTLHGDLIEVEIRGQGPGLPEEELRHLLDPGFRVAEGRVASCNWSLFGARQIVRQHGGEISIRSSPGRGATVIVSLPVVPTRVRT